MGLKDLAAKALKALATCGSAAGSSFPLGTKIATGATEGERCIYLTYPDKSEEVVYHHSRHTHKICLHIGYCLGKGSFGLRVYTAHHHNKKGLAH